MADKKKRKLRVKKTGAGDPTVLVRFELPQIDPSDISPVALDIEAYVGPTFSDLVFSINGAYTPTTEGEMITILFSFSTTDQTILNIIKNKKNPLPVKLKFTFPNASYEEYDYSIENTLDAPYFGQVSILAANPSTSYISDITYTDTPVLAAHNPNLGPSQDVALHFDSSDENENLVFLSSNGGGNLPITEQVYFSTVANDKWILENIGGDSFTLFNEGNSMYLGVSGQTLAWYPSNPAPMVTPEMTWLITPQTLNLGLFYFQNAGIPSPGNSFLSADPGSGWASLSSTPCQWYIHNPSS